MEQIDLLPDPLKDRVILDVNPPPQLPLKTKLLFPKNDGVPDWKVVRDFFTKEGKLNKKDLLSIFSTFIELLKKEQNVIKIADPCTIVGDIHGQYYDLLKILEVGGAPDQTKYCFLGDYVDRGSFSTESFILLMCLKINYPETFTLLRGNHESRQMTSFFNFHLECTIKYDKEIYERFMDSFDALPLAAIINGKFLAVHGGISPHLKDIKEINDIQRFEETPKEGAFCDFLWSDPIEEESEAVVSEWEENLNRGCSFNFGAKALLPYLNNNGLVSVIRAHEAQLEGFKMYKWNKKVDFPSCVTVFSAANYCDVYNNKGAIIKFKNNLFNLVQFNCSPHPFLLPDFQNLFSWSLPFISEKISEMLLQIIQTDDETLKIVKKENLNESSLFEEASSSLRMKIIICSTMMRMFKTLREEKELIIKLKGFCPGNKIPKGILLQGADALKSAYERYTKVKSLDLINEKRPKTNTKEK